MATGSFYVYALLDPRENPPRPFYIGKGSGSRAYAHMVEDGEGRKIKRIRDVESAGYEVVVRQLVSDLSELDALRVEAQLIAAHGTLETGGILLNRVVPSGENEASGSVATVPTGAIEKAQLGLGLLKEAILELAAVNPKGITNADAVNCLGLQSDHGGKQRNYLSWSVLGVLMREGKVKKVTGSSPRDSRYKYVQIGQTGTV